jgi:hypothetical protein
MSFTQHDILALLTAKHAERLQRLQQEIPALHKAVYDVFYIWRGKLLYDRRVDQHIKHVNKQLHMLSWLTGWSHTHESLYHNDVPELPTSLDLIDKNTRQITVRIRYIFSKSTDTPRFDNPQLINTYCVLKYPVNKELRELKRKWETALKAYYDCITTIHKVEKLRDTLPTKALELFMTTVNPELAKNVTSDIDTWLETQINT